MPEGFHMNEQEQQFGQPELANVAAPVAISATPRSESSISVTWGYNAGGGHTGTRLKWALNGSPVGQFDVPIIGLTYVITGLVANTQYQISAFGLKGNEVSPVSKDVLATTKPSTALPASPTNLAATPTKNSMALTWTGPANASSYKLSYGLAPSGAVIGSATSVTAAHTFSGLNSGTSYYFDVRSSNNVGDSQPARITKQTLQVPATPTGLRATPTISTLDVEWSASTGATDYVLRYGVEPGGAATTLTTRLLRESLANLNKNTLYFIEVSARNSNGESEAARITQRTLDGPALPPKPGTLYVESTHDTVSIIWGPPQSAQYKISIGIESQQREFFASESTSYMNHRFQHLLPDTRYFIEVRAINASGESPPSISSTATKTFPVPRELSVNELTDDSALMSWSAGAEYSASTRYELYLGDRLLTTLSERTYRLTGLTESTEYLFRVRARNSGGYGLGDYFSDYVSKSFKTPPYTGVRICSPGNVRADRNTPTSATLTWDEPYATCSLCPDAVGYEVSGEGIATLNVTRPPCVVTGLSAGREYRLVVRAKAAGNNISGPSDVLVGLPATGTSTT